MRKDRFEDYWKDARVQSAALYLEAGRSADEVVEGLIQSQIAEGLRAYTNNDLRGKIFEIFEETFVVTRVLRGVAMTVAVLGVLLSLSILVMEKRRELALLRAQGASRGFVAWMVFWEAQLIGLIASFIGTATGLVLAVVLTWVINKAFFGWSIDLAFPWAQVAFTPLWIALSATIAAIWPARVAAGIPITDALRTE
jgi:putative ABC transport system permease protein